MARYSLDSLSILLNENSKKTRDGARSRAPKHDTIEERDVANQRDVDGGNLRDVHTPMSPDQRESEFRQNVYGSLPRYPRDLPPLRMPIALLTVLYYTLLSKYSPYLALFMALTWIICPFADIGILAKLLSRSLSFQPFGKVSIVFNGMGFTWIGYQLFVRFPVETIFWYIDEIFFPSYKQTEIREPLFVLGQPRSGTTMFESLLSEDKEHFCTPLLYEMRFPFLSVQYIVDFVAYIDKQYTAGKIWEYINKGGFFDALPEEGDRKNMRRLRYDMPDEDDLLFWYYCGFHFMYAGFFPEEEYVRLAHRFHDLPEATQKRYMEFHRRVIQKVLYRRGRGRRYMAKWVDGWNGQLDEAKTTYPGAKYCVLVRDPKESLRSWLKLQGLLAEQLTGNNYMKTMPDVRQLVIKENILWFQNEVEFCQSTPKENLLVLRTNDICEDIPTQIHHVYKFLRRSIREGSAFETVVQEAARKQKAHKKTAYSSEEAFISDFQIIHDFPDLLKEIRFSHPPVSAIKNQ